MCILHYTRPTMYSWHRIEKVGGTDQCLFQPCVPKVTRSAASVDREFLREPLKPKRQKRHTYDMYM